jgi:hypothetical protein
MKSISQIMTHDVVNALMPFLDADYLKQVLRRTKFFRDDNPRRARVSSLDDIVIDSARPELSTRAGPLNSTLGAESSGRKASNRQKKPTRKDDIC